MQIFDPSEQTVKGEAQRSASKGAIKRSLSRLTSGDEEKSELRKALSELKKMQSDSSTNLPTNESEYTLSSILGQGRFGIVRMAYQGGNKAKPCVIKLYNKVKLIQANALHTVEVLAVDQNEVSILKSLNHKNIVKLIDYTQHSQSIQVILEYGGYLNLYDYLETKQPTKRDLKNVFRGVCDAIKYLHEQAIAHRDLKLENIVLADNLQDGQVSASNVKLIDFGFAARVSAGEPFVQQVGTPAYMAPELSRKEPYDGLKIDVWALGVLLYRLLYRELPFKAKDCFELYSKISSDEVSFPKLPYDRDTKLANDLIIHLLKKDPKQRYTIQEVV